MAPRVAIVDYDPRWPGLFDEEKDRLLEALRPYVLAAEHVGSTAVPGLASKPTIDIAVALFRLEDAACCIPRMEKLGYEYVPAFEKEFPQRRYFRRGRTETAQATHQVHVVEAGSEFFDRHLLFRDWLRAHPEDAEAYAALKRRLALERGADREGYADGKTPFIRGIEEKARAARAQACDLRLRRAAGEAPPPG